MKPLIPLILLFLLPACTLFRGQDKQETVSTEFVTGQWIELASLNRIKAGDLSEPYPFGITASHDDIFTCFRDGKPYVKDRMNDYGFLDKKDDRYEWTDGNITVTLKFRTTATDTLVVFQYQSKTSEPFIHTLARVPRGGECSFDHYPGKVVRSGASLSYHQYYFEGKYRVKTVGSEEEAYVELGTDQQVTGLDQVGYYTVYAKCAPILVTLFELDTLHNRPFRIGDQTYPRTRRQQVQYLALEPRDDGFDLFKTNYSTKSSLYERRHKVLEKAYEFRRVD